MKAVVGSLALTTLSTVVSAIPHGRPNVYERAPELAVPGHEQLQPRQLSLPTGGPPPPPASLPYAFGLSNTVPAPIADGGTAWKGAFARAAAVVAQMTTEEKLTFVSGQDGRCASNTLAIERLDLPSLCFLDGPTGPRFATGVTQMPSELTTASTWDRDLMYKRANAMGHEFYNLGVHVALGPVTGGPAGRSPLGGRGWENFSPDPYLTGVGSYYSVKGIQDAGVAATSKHYVAYEQETFRNVYGGGGTPNSGFGSNEQLPIDSILGNQVEHELYSWPFAEAVRAGTSWIMTGYNMVNGTHVSANSEIINGVLKGEFGFNGAVMSDWGGTWDGPNTLNAGQDIDNPGQGLGGALGSFFADDLPAALANGTISESRLDDAVRRILTPFYQLGQADTPLPPAVVSFLNLPGTEAIFKNVVTQEALDTARQIAEDGVVLLRNEGVLPLNPKQNRRIGVFGQDAGSAPLGATAEGSTGIQPEYYPYGAYTMGGGSGWTYPNNLIDPLAAIRFRALESFSQVQGVTNNNATAQIAAAAAQVDIAIVFVSAQSEEGAVDRSDLSFSRNGAGVIDAAVANNNNTIIVTFNPGAVDIAEYATHPNVTAIIAAGFPGEQAGIALANVIYGDVSPSGKLPFTMGASLADYPPNGIQLESVPAPKVEFTEGSFIDYRWFDREDISPVYEFGFGLSYSKFSYSGLSLERKFEADKTSIQFTNEDFVGKQRGDSIYDTIAEVSIDIKNDGDVLACEVAQLYVEFPENEGQPKLQLRGFEKIKQLKAGATETATFSIRRKDVMVWDVVLQKWRAPKDGYVNFHVGASSRKLPFKTTYKFE